MFTISRYPPNRSKVRAALNKLSQPVPVDQFIADNNITVLSLKTGVSRHKTEDGSRVQLGYLPDGTRVVYRRAADGSIVGAE